MDTTTALPTLFVSHGSPMFALDPGQTGPALRNWGESVQALNPKAVVVMSPHWMARDATVMTNLASAWH